MTPSTTKKIERERGSTLKSPVNHKGLYQRERERERERERKREKNMNRLMISSPDIPPTPSRLLTLLEPPRQGNRRHWARTRNLVTSSFT